MQLPSTYQEAAAAYAEGVRSFYAPGAQPVTRGAHERAAAGAVPVAELSQRADVLAQRSAALTEAASAALEAENVEARLQASVSLLAKALTDLQVSSTLFAAAEEEGEAGHPVTRGVERSAAISRPMDLERNLALLLGEEPKGAVSRGAGEETPKPKTVSAARRQIADFTPTVLTLIRDRAADTGWSALGGLAGLGTGELTKAAGLVGMQVAGALGQAGTVTHLYELVTNFVGQAYASLQALIGPALTQTLGEQAVSWVKSAATGDKFKKLLEKLYKTEATCAELIKLSNGSSAGLPKYIAALDGVNALEATYRKQIELIGKIIKGLGFVAMIPAVALPQGKLVLAAVYLMVGGYTVLAGGDYVDAKNLKCIDRVPGVRRIMETNLA